MNNARPSIPANAGFGLRHPHVLQVITRPPPVDWVEVHTENYMYAGGPRLRQLEAVRERFALSFHGVGLSLGTVDEPDLGHLRRIRKLVDRFDPVAVSDHIAWVRAPAAGGGASLNDLLPLPCTEEAVAALARNIGIFQDAIGREVLVENPSMYLQFAGGELDHAALVAETVARAGCRLLLDVNNIYVSAANLGFDAAAYLAAMPFAAVAEIHLAGHAERVGDGGSLLLDDHGSRVCDGVWALYEAALAQTGPVATLVEWDTDIPALAVLLQEVTAAQSRLDHVAASAVAADVAADTYDGPMGAGAGSRNADTGEGGGENDEGLAQAQCRFAASVSGDPAGVLPLIHDDGRRAERLDIHRGNMFSSLNTVLADAFPTVSAILGESLFGRLSAAFVRHAPPQANHLLDYGAALPDFVRRSEPLADRPWLGDVAELDWAVAHAYGAAEASPAVPDDLAALTPEALLQVRLALPPSARLLSSDWPVHAIRMTPSVAEAPGGVAPRAGHLLVIRPEAEVMCLPLTGAEHAFLAALDGGAPLGEAATGALSVDPSFDIQDVLARCLIDGHLVASVTVTDTE